MKLCIGMLLALASAGALNIGFYVQHNAANEMVGFSLRHPIHGLIALFSNGQWLLGYAAGWLGWGLYVAALWCAPLSWVQSVAAGGVGILALLAHRLGKPLGERERWGAGLAVTGLVLLCVSLRRQAGSPHAIHPAELLGVVVVGTVVAGGSALCGVRWGHAAWPLAASAGLAYAVSDLAAKACVDGQVAAFLPFVVGCAVLGFVALQFSFQHGPVMATAGLSNLINNSVPILGGVLIFHELVPGGLPGVARIAAFATVIVGAVLLSHQPADRETADASAHLVS
jgi:hypothetical protein